MDIYNVVLRNKLQNDLKKLPRHIIAKLTSWIKAVKDEGLLQVRKIPGYHDEPLQGKRNGQRSIRLTKAYRAIYIIDRMGQMEIVEIIEVNKHDY